MTTDQLFQKKQECAGQKTTIQEAIIAANKLYKKWTYFTHDETLFEIFYSPVKNSCLYAVSVTEEQDESVCNFYKIYDLYSEQMEEIYLIENEDRSCNWEKTLAEFNTAFKELKWE